MRLLHASHFFFFHFDTLTDVPENQGREMTKFDVLLTTSVHDAERSL